MALVSAIMLNVGVSCPVSRESGLSSLGCSVPEGKKYKDKKCFKKEGCLSGCTRRSIFFGTVRDFEILKNKIVPGRGILEQKYSQ